METLLNQDTCTISGLATALGRGTDQVKFWLTKGGMHLFSKSGNGWRRFATMDVAQLALAAPLIDFGVNKEIAIFLARDLLEQKSTATKRNWVTDLQLAAAFASERAIIRHDADQWRAVLVQDRKPLGKIEVPHIVISPCPLILKAFWRLSPNDIE